MDPKALELAQKAMASISKITPVRKFVSKRKRESKPQTPSDEVPQEIAKSTPADAVTLRAETPIADTEQPAKSTKRGRTDEDRGKKVVVAKEPLTKEQKRLAAAALASRPKSLVIRDGGAPEKGSELTAPSMAAEHQPLGEKASGADVAPQDKVSSKAKNSRVLIPTPLKRGLKVHERMMEAVDFRFPISVELPTSFDKEVVKMMTDSADVAITRIAALKEGVQGLFDQCNNQAIMLQDLLSKSEEANTEVTNLRAENEKLTQLRAENEQLSIDVGKLRKDAERWFTEKKGLQKSVKDLTDEKKELASSKKQLEVDLETARSEAVHWKSQAERVEKELQETKDAMAAACISSFYNALDQVELLNPGEDLRIDLAHPSNIVEGMEILERQGDGSLKCIFVRDPDPSDDSDQGKDTKVGEGGEVSSSFKPVVQLEVLPTQEVGEAAVVITSDPQVDGVSDIAAPASGGLSEVIAAEGTGVVTETGVNVSVHPLDLEDWLPPPPLEEKASSSAPVTAPDDGAKTPPL